MNPENMNDFLPVIGIVIGIGIVMIVVVHVATSQTQKMICFRAWLGDVLTPRIGR